MSRKPTLVDGKTPAPGEFEVIASLFAPLTGGRPEALGLTDDAALLAPRDGFELVVTTDQMIAGRHAMGFEPYDWMAKKALRRCLSDLAAKGADADLYFLNIAWPKGLSYEAMRTFAAGLLADQTEFGVRLAGGDTAVHDGPLHVSITAMGWVPTGHMLKRSGAVPGDLVFATGTIGDAAAGLRVLQGTLALGDDDAAHVRNRYHIPQPRMAMADVLRGRATAALDVSDGLLSDLEHLARASGVHIEIDIDRIPISPAVKNWIEGGPDTLEALAAAADGGDDYEIVFTASIRHSAQIGLLAAAAGVEVTPIGRVWPGQGVATHLNAAPFDLPRRGHRHF